MTDRKLAAINQLIFVSIVSLLCSWVGEVSSRPSPLGVAHQSSPAEVGPRADPQTPLDRRVTLAPISNDHEKVKEKLLQKMGLNSVPNTNLINITIEEKRQLIKQYREYMAAKNALQETYDQQLDSNSPESEEIFFDQDEVWVESMSSTRRRSNSRSYRMSFNLALEQPEDPYRERVATAAELKIYQRRTFPRTPCHQDCMNKIKVYQLLSNNITSKQSVKNNRKLIASKSIHVLRSGWQKFDISDVVKYWLNNPDENYGLEIIAESRAVHKRITFGAASHSAYRFRSRSGKQSHNYVETQPLRASGSLLNKFVASVNVISEERHILGKVKRSVVKDLCQTSEGETNCCRYPVWISFQEIGWDSWVIAPEGFQAYYCSGACPFRYNLANNFAGIKSVLNHSNPSSQVPAPTCTATKYGQIELLQMDEHGDYVMKEYPDMVVERCECS